MSTTANDNSLADREPLDQLADEFLARYRAGDRPAIHEYAAAHPELAAEIEELFPTLVVLERLGPRPEEISDRISEPAAGAAPNQLGEYRILREVGRGGMGVVYEAVQESLGRHVALKVLPSHALLDALRLKRFQHEAQAAARLHHTNIVPVFGVGTEGGVHFYAMQFIQGRGLNEVIDELRRLKETRESGSSHGPPVSAPPLDDTPLAANLSTISDTPQYYRSIARLGAQVADALEYAHRQGILHRDIKPANLLLDASGTVWVTDFGLAKAEGMEELTQTGDVIGTLRYTAPERMRGHGDVRADICSLGLTLYELLTLRPAFDAADRVSLVRQITQDEPPRPRKLDARIPRDLDTIVLKAIAKEPSRRYFTAGEMADDLRRYLGDRPIEARRTAWWEHTWRWGRRNPAVAASIAAAFAALLLGLGASLWQWNRANRNFQMAESSAVQASANAARAKAHATQAEKDFQLAFEAVDQMLARAGYEDLYSVPHMEQSRKALLQDAVRFYETLLQGRENRPELRREMLKSHARLGSIHVWLGDYEAAERECALTVAMAEALLGDQPRNVEYRVLLAEACSALGTVRAYRSQSERGESDLQKALQQWQALLASSDDNPTYVVSQARIRFRLGVLYHKWARWDLAVQCLEQALQDLESLPTQKRESSQCRLLMGDVLQGLASLAEDRQSLDQAEKYLRRAAAEFEPLFRERYTIGIRIRLASAYSNLAETLAERRRGDDEAGRYYARSLKISEKLVDEFPLALPYQRELAAASDSFGRWLLVKRRYDEAASAHRRALQLWEAQLSGDDIHGDSRMRLASCQHNLALSLRYLRDHAGAIHHLRQAVRQQELAIEADRKNAKAIKMLSQHQTTLEQVLRSQGDLSGIEDSRKEQIAFYDRLLAEGQSAAVEARGAQLQAYSRLGILLLDVDRLDEARRSFEHSVELARRLVADAPEEPKHHSELGAMLHHLAAVAHRQGSASAAVSLLEQAIVEQDRALSAAPDEMNFRRFGASHHGLLADVLVDLGDYRAAAEHSAVGRRRFPDLHAEYRRAVTLARCLALVQADDRLNEQEQNELAELYAAQAMELLQAAAQKDPKVVAKIEAQPELAPLRERPSFQAWQATLIRPKE